MNWPQPLASLSAAGGCEPALSYAGLLALACTLVALAWQFRRLRDRAAALERQIAALAPTAALAPADGGAAELITIEILNPMQLAASRSRLADVFGSLTPALVQREVYRQTCAILEQQLREHGVAAEVRLCRGA